MLSLGTFNLIWIAIATGYSKLILIQFNSVLLTCFLFFVNPIFVDLGRFIFFNYSYFSLISYWNSILLHGTNILSSNDHHPIRSVVREQGQLESFTTSRKVQTILPSLSPMVVTQLQSRERESRKRILEYRDLIVSWHLCAKKNDPISSQALILPTVYCLKVNSLLAALCSLV